MATCSVSKSVFLKVPRESSAMRSPRDADDVRQSWKHEKKLREQLQNALNQTEIVTRTVEKMRRRILGGIGSMSGLHFQQPDVELDPTIAVAKWTIVNVSPTNPMTSLATALFDLVSGNQTVAPTGYWVAIADIPAQVVNPPGEPAGTYYNVPVMPPSVAWVSSPGSQKGDLDQPGILWWPLPRMGPCIS